MKLPKISKESEGKDAMYRQWKEQTFGTPPRTQQNAGCSNPNRNHRKIKTSPGRLQYQYAESQNKFRELPPILQNEKLPSIVQNGKLPTPRVTTPIQDDIEFNLPTIYKLGKLPILHPDGTLPSKMQYRWRRRSFRTMPISSLQPEKIVQYGHLVKPPPPPSRLSPEDLNHIPVLITECLSNVIPGYGDDSKAPTHKTSSNTHHVTNNSAPTDIEGAPQKLQCKKRRKRIRKKEKEKRPTFKEKCAKVKLRRKEAARLNRYFTIMQKYADSSDEDDEVASKNTSRVEGQRERLVRTRGRRKRISNRSPEDVVHSMARAKVASAKNQIERASYPEWIVTRRDRCSKTQKRNDWLSEIQDTMDDMADYWDYDYEAW